MSAVDAKVYKLNPLHVAILERNESKLVDLLERKVCDVNAGDIHGWTPLHHAGATQQVGLMAPLKQHGAKENLLNDRYGTAQDLLRLTTHMTKMLYVATNVIALSYLFFNEIINLADVEALVEFCPNSISACNQEIILPAFRIYSEARPMRKLALRDVIKDQFAKGRAEFFMDLIGRIPEMKRKGMI